MRMWDVSGSFLIPGPSREKGDLKVRVAAETRQQASKDLMGALRQKYSAELSAANRDRLGNPFDFSPSFALMHLHWHEVTPPPVVLTLPELAKRVAKDQWLEVVREKAANGQGGIANLPMG